MDCVVLAGGKNSIEMRQATGADLRSLAPLAGRPMLEYILQALRESAGIGRILVIGDVPKEIGGEVITPERSMVENLYKGLSMLEGSSSLASRILIATSDIPFITPDAIADFIEQADRSDADLCYPIIRLAQCQNMFPEMHRTTIKIKEGVFTGGNLIALNPRVMMAQREVISAAYAARKQPLRLGKMLGFGVLLRLVLAQTVSPSLLTLSRLEQSVSRLIGCRAAAIITDYAEIGADVDKLDDYKCAEARLAHRNGDEEK